MEHACLVAAEPARSPADGLHICIVAATSPGAKVSPALCLAHSPADHSNDNAQRMGQPGMRSSHRHAHNRGDRTTPAAADTPGAHTNDARLPVSGEVLVRTVSVAHRAAQADGACLLLAGDSVPVIAAAAGIAARWNGADASALAALFSLGNPGPGRPVPFAVADTGVAGYEGIRHLAAGALAVSPLEGQEGELLGLLCLANREPGDWATGALTLLDDLAAIAASHLMDRSGLATGTGHDVALPTSEAHFQAITESSPFGVFLSSPEGHCLYTNATFRRLIGWREEEAAGGCWLDAAHPEDRADLESLWSEARGAGIPFTAEFRVVRPDGWTSIVGVRLTPAGGDGSYVGSMEDVTERITFEKLVQDSESRFRNLFEGLGDAVFVEGPDHHIRMVNPAGETMFGRPRADLVGLEGDQLFADPKAAAYIRQRMANWDGDPILTETCFARPDGFTFPGELRLCGYRDDSGEIVGFIGSVRDIQERRQAEQKLRASEAFANAIFDNAPVASAVFSPDGSILRINDAHRNTLAVRAGSSRTFNIFSDPTFSRSGLPPLFRRALAGEVIYRDELVLDFDAYHAAWSMSTGRKVFDVVLYPIITDGVVEAVVSFARDVTGRKATEERAARLAAIVESTNDAIIAMDFRGMILSWNGGAERLYGYEADEMIGHSIFLIVPAEHEAKVWDSLDQVQRGEPTEPFEALCVARDEHHVDVRIAVSPIRDTSGNLVGASVIQSDITEQKRMEAELRRSSAVQQAILDSANVSIIATDPNGYITMMNNTAQAWLGYSTASLAGKLTPVIFHDRAELADRAKALSAELESEIRPGFPVFVAKSALTGQPDEREWTYIRRNGERFPVLLSVSALRDSSGLLTGYLCVASDLTERKKWEDALRESEERYRATFESLHDMFYQTDLSGRFTLVSPSAKALLGYTADELTGVDAATLYAGGAFPETLVSEIAQGRVLNDFEADFIHKDGHTVHVSLNAKLVYDSSGQPVGVQGTSRDIGERKRAEEERDRIFRLSVDMIAVVTPGGRFLRVNPAWEKTLGYSETELLGVSAWHFAHPDDRGRAIERARATMAGSEVRDLTLRFFARDGSVRWLSWAVTPVTGGLSYCVARDVTEAVRSREQVEEMLEVVQANAAALREQAEELDQLRIAAEQLANRDMLTGTANRRAWFAHAHQTRPTAVAIFDIDFFKTVNDTYGHPAGDAVLVEVARRLGSLLPEGAVLGRVGGEEFAVLFYQPFAKVREAVEAAANAVSATPIALERAILINVSVSGGLAPWHAGGDSREQSLAQTYEDADAALYEAKATGRRKVVVRPLRRHAA